MTNTRYTHWKIDDLPWGQFDRSKVNPDLLKLIKAAALVEYNAHDYARYMRGIFANDPAFQSSAESWADEEVQHGAALARWACMADPDFDFEAAFRRFTTGYKVSHFAANESVRGSQSGELIARCIVETGTSSYYTAIGDAVDEPVLKAICRRIAADELRHYKLFYDFLKRYLQQESLNRIERLRIAVGRMWESEDDELAYAFYAANAPLDETYARKKYNIEYLGRAYKFYHPHHVDRVVAMLFKACGLKPHTALHGVVSKAVWWAKETKARKNALAKAA
ncbi:MAG: ferritin-like domain-containing protein [Alphaproteobacteria bacterium]|nr:ferritin-like domain-containing protein [Alphaproteobacteria bacterium]